MTDPDRPPRSSDRPEGDPVEEEDDRSGRTPHPTQPAEGEDTGSGGADTP